MQECGQPPSEIVKDLAPGNQKTDAFRSCGSGVPNLLSSSLFVHLSPGLQFDDEGMPIMPNMVRHSTMTRACRWLEILSMVVTDLLLVGSVVQGPGMFPGMAGLPGMPSK